ncbi:MAG: Hpt domain-containing protein [Thioalkalispiraceae bacterium]|jgi:HPt (histidine-containing phosphotransfer) domain-containing protein
MNDADLMNLETIKSLRSALDDGIGELFDQFINDCPDALHRLENAVAQNDVTEVNILAHYLKGSSGNLGAQAFSDACKALELQARDNKLLEPEAQIQTIKQLFDKTVHYMKRQMA